MDSLAFQSAVLAADPEFAAEWERLAVARTVAVSLIGYRADHGLSQRELAHRLGMRTSRVVDLGSGEINPKLETLAMIAAATGIEYVIDVAPTGQEPTLVTQAVVARPACVYAGASVLVAAR